MSDFQANLRLKDVTLGAVCSPPKKNQHSQPGLKKSTRVALLTYNYK